MSYVRFNVSRMFVFHEPYECSGSVAELGPRAAQLTWDNSLAVAHAHLEAAADDEPGWLVSPLDEALDYARTWAKDTGAWERAEIDSWSDEECLALLVQNVASDMRHLDADNCPLLECTYEGGSEVAEYVSGWYWVEAGELMGEVCS